MNIGHLSSSSFLTWISGSYRLNFTLKSKADLAKIALVATCVFAGALFLKRKYFDRYLDWKARQFAVKLAHAWSDEDGGRNRNRKVSDFVQGRFFWQSRSRNTLDPNITISSQFNFLRSPTPTLNLSSTNLTDRHLREMARTGCFQDVKTLILSGNPQLTGQGIAWLEGGEFLNLEHLYLGGNFRVIREGLGALRVAGFPNLKMLSLTHTNLGESELEKLIDEIPWFRRLEGLYISGNPELKRLPHNILRLEGLGECAVRDGRCSRGSVGGPVYYDGIGLMGNLPSSSFTPETVVLFRASRTDGLFFHNARRLFSWAPSLMKSVSTLCREANIPLPSDDPARMTALRAACVRYEIPFEDS